MASWLRPGGSVGPVGDSVGCPGARGWPAPGTQWHSLEVSSFASFSHIYKVKRWAWKDRGHPAEACGQGGGGAALLRWRPDVSVTTWTTPNSSFVCNLSGKTFIRVTVPCNPRARLPGAGGAAVTERGVVGERVAGRGLPGAQTLGCVWTSCRSWGRLSQRGWQACHRGQGTRGCRVCPHLGVRVPSGKVGPAGELCGSPRSQSSRTELGTRKRPGGWKRRAAERAGHGGCRAVARRSRRGRGEAGEAEVLGAGTRPGGAACGWSRCALASRGARGSGPGQVPRAACPPPWQSRLSPRPHAAQRLLASRPLETGARGRDGAGRRAAGKQA